LLSFLYLTLITSSACWVMSSLPSWAFVSGIVWGICLLLGGYLLSRKNMILIFGLNILLLYGLSGSSNLFFLLIFGIPSFIMGLLLSGQKGYYELQKWGMLTAVLLTSLFLVMTYYYAGDDAITTIQAEINQYINESGNLSDDSEFLKLYEQQGISPEEVKNNITLLVRWIVIHQPALYCIQSILAVYLILICSAYISRRKQLPILTHKPFREEKMPWQFAWAIIIALSLWLWGRDGMMNLYYIGSNLLVIAIPITVYYGLAGLAYLWPKAPPRRRKWTMIFLVIFCVLFPLAAIIFISLLGLFDSLLDYRKLDYKKEGTR
jgi:uncharacterized protein YybS (DUF2232 family)